MLREVLAEGSGRGRARALVVIDEGLASGQPALRPAIEDWFRANADVAELVAPPLAIEGGERTKNAWDHVGEIHETIERHDIDRHNYVIAIGGGALLDMAGLAAATAHRGVRHIRFPTTTLAQADSGVGVKNGINAFGKKNFIGTFAPPFAVVNDFEMLRSLPPRDKRAGYSEAVKVACIRDRAFFEWMEGAADRLARFERDAMHELIHRCAELHVHHIATSGDPFEFGSARPLDFGHWSAHKLEQMTDYRIRHGEAVAMGIAVDVMYSRNAGLLDEASAERVVRLLERLGFEVYARELHHRHADGELQVLRGLEEFRQHLGGELTITLLRGIGSAVEVHSMDRTGIIAALDALRARSKAGQASV